MVACEEGDEGLAYVAGYAGDEDEHCGEVDLGGWEGGGSDGMRWFLMV